MKTIGLFVESLTTLSKKTPSRLFLLFVAAYLVTKKERDFKMYMGKEISLPDKRMYVHNLYRLLRNYHTPIHDNETLPL